MIVNPYKFSKTECKNPTEAEKKMFFSCGMYPIKNDLDEIKYCKLGNFKSFNFYPHKIVKDECNNYFMYDSYISFSLNSKSVSVSNKFLDVNLLSLILERCRELGWE